MATIPVNDVTPRVQYTATAGQTVFAYTFLINADADLKVYQTLSGATPNDAADLLTLTTHYTVTGEGTENGGDVTLVTGAADGDVITIERDIAVERDSDYQNLGDLASADFNTDFDNGVLFAQQNETSITRAPLLQRATQVSLPFTMDDPTALYIARAKADLSGIDWVTVSSLGGGVIGTDLQAWDEQLDDIAALAVTDGNIIVGDGSTFVAESGATARTSLGLAIGTDVAAAGANSDITSITGLTTDLTVAQGGTGASTFAVNGILFGNTAGAIQATAVGTATHVLTSNGVGVAPTFQAAAGGGVFTESFTSAEQTITAAGLLTLAHSLTSTPVLFELVAICKTAENNYSIGDLLVVSKTAEASASTNGYGLGVRPDATNVYIRFGNTATSTLLAVDNTTGATVTLTNANWKLIVRAWV